jgi:protoporphyrin/coproporphyrin ferrochelatase
MSDHDSLLVISFGGPEGPDEVMPFLERVTAGRNVPRERLLEVAEHYHHFGGVSPINARTRELVEALRASQNLPVFWGNRHSRPWLAQTVEEMRSKGHRKAHAFATSALSSYSSCRVYLEAIDKARAEVNGAPIIEKLRPYCDHRGYIETCRARLIEACAPFERPHVLFTAHSIPRAMASGCAYQAQLEVLAARVADGLDLASTRMVYQSRSGPPQVPWLEPDVLDAMRELGKGPLVIAPIGFVADHMEVVWDLDVEAAELARELGIPFARAATAGTHPRFVAMVSELIAEKSGESCPPDCCSAGRRP